MNKKSFAHIKRRLHKELAYVSSHENKNSLMEWRDQWAKELYLFIINKPEIRHKASILITHTTDVGLMLSYVEDLMLNWLKSATCEDLMPHFTEHQIFEMFIEDINEPKITK